MVVTTIHRRPPLVASPPSTSMRSSTSRAPSVSEGRNPSPLVGTCTALVGVGATVVGADRSLVGPGSALIGSGVAVLGLVPPPCGSRTVAVLVVPTFSSLSSTTSSPLDRKLTTWAPAVSSARADAAPRSCGAGPLAARPPVLLAVAAIHVGTDPSKASTDTTIPDDVTSSTGSGLANELAVPMRTMSRGRSS